MVFEWPSTLGSVSPAVDMCWMQAQYPLAGGLQIGTEEAQNKP